MSRETGFSCLALVLLIAAGILVAAPSGVADVPLRTSLETIPGTFPGWSATNNGPERILPLAAGAADRLGRGFADNTGSIWVLVEYFPTQNENRRAAAGDLVYPAVGWSQLEERGVSLQVPAASGGRLNANLIVIEEGGRRYAIAYWYQIGQAAVASDHWYRVRLLYNRIVHGRTDGALIRMASPVASGEDPAVVVARYARFLGVFYPELLRRLPG